MKKVYFALLGLLVLFAACKKESKNKPEKQIVGTWTSKEIVYDSYDLTGKLTHTEKEPYVATWTFTETQLTTKDADGTQTYQYTISKNNDKTILSVTGEIKFEVKGINNNELYLSHEETYSTGKDVTSYSFSR